MFECFNLNKISFLIQNIVENIQCGSCEKLKGNIVRFKCGHISCEDCAAAVNECVECNTDDSTVSRIKYTCDPVYTKQVKCTVDLLNAFQQAFKIDVTHMQRFSEQQKIEKEIFPECIQAERKYYNKRKIILKQSRPNSLSFIIPGEAVPNPKLMENKMDRVKKWIEKIVIKTDKPKRCAFTDLDVNSPRKKKNKFTNSSEEILTPECSNQPYASKNKNKTIVNKYVNCSPKNLYLNDYINKEIPPGAIQYDSAIFSDDDEAVVIEDSQTEKNNKQDQLSNNKPEIILRHRDSRQRGNHKNLKKDLSLTEDEPIVIDDTESFCIDKDKEALLAVIAADKTVFKPNSSHSQSNKLNVLKERFVPFVNKCCPPDIQAKRDDVIKCDKLKITIESDNYIVRITEVSNDESSFINKQSQGVQTDFDETILKPINKKPETNNCDTLKDSTNHKNIEEDIFTDQTSIDKKNIIQKNNIRKSNDSDSESIGFKEISVFADVHMPRSQNLSPSLLKELKVVVPKLRNKRFIASSDSSEKENKDPNTRRGIIKKHKKTNIKKPRKNYK